MFTSWTTHPGWQAIGWTMIHFLWIGSVIGLITFTGRVALYRCRPHLRYAFLVAAFALLAATPWPILRHLLHASALPFSHNSPPTEPAVTLSSPGGSLGAGSVMLLPEDISAGESAPPPASLPADPAVRSWYGAWKACLGRVALVAPWLWLIGTPLTLLLICCGFGGAWYWRRYSQPVSEHWVVDLSNRLRLSLKIGREVVVAVSEKVASPVLIGVVKPMILLPPALISGCTTEQLEMVLIHELAHVKRWDPWVNLFLQIVKCLLFFHPAVWILSRWIRAECESCCDDIVLQRTGAPQSYAETLAYLALPDDFPLLSSLGLARHPLVDRIRRILQWQDHSLRLSPLLFLSLMLVLLTGLALAVGMNQDQTGWALNTTHADAKDPSSTKVLYFPEDQIVGSVSIRENGNYDINSTAYNWTRLGHAVGQVEIPAHHQVKLSIKPDAARDLVFLRKLDPNDISVLNLTSCQVNDVNLQHVAHLTGLDSLVLARTEISDQDLMALNRLSRLRYLGMSSTSIGDEGLTHLAKCPSLAFIRLHGTRITDHGLAALSQLQGLQGLQLGQTNISNAGLQHLSTLKELRHLMFDGRNAITDEGLVHLSALTALEYLSLSGLPITDKGLQSLASLTALKMLLLSGTKVTDAGLIHLKPLRALEALRLPRDIGAGGWAELAGHPALRFMEAQSDAHLAHAVSFPELRRLEIGGKCTDAGMDYVAKLPQLEQLRFNYMSVAHNGIAKLARLKELGKLSPDEGAAMMSRLLEEPSNSNAVTDKGLAKLAGLKKLRELRLSNTNVTDEGLQVLSRFPALEELAVYGFRGSAKGLSHLEHLDSLRRLSLDFDDRDALTDDAIAPIAKLTGLVSLRLEGQLSDEGLRHLEPLTQLEQLHLKGTWLTDKGITRLTCFPGLETLSLKGHFTNRAIIDLVKLKSLRMLTLTGNIEISTANEVILAAMPSMRYLRLERDSADPRAIMEKLAAQLPAGQRQRFLQNAPGPVPAIERFVGANGQPGTRWAYTFKEVNGSATLDMYGVTIVFEREQRSGSSRGTMQVSGIGSGRARSGAGNRAFSREYANGVNTMQFLKYEFKLLDGGKRLSIQGKEVDLSQGKKLVTVEKDGSVKTENI